MTESDKIAQMSFIFGRTTAFLRSVQNKFNEEEELECACLINDIEEIIYDIVG